MIEIKIPANPKYLKLIRRLITDLCELAGFSVKASRHVTLAIDEACTNIIRHAYGGTTERPITLHAWLLPDRLRIVLHDEGKPATIAALQSRKLDDIRPGGLGIHLIKSVMDTFEYHAHPQMNELVLEKLFQNSREK